MLFVSHLAAFCTAFSSILPCVQQQNARHLAPKRTPFSTKTHSIQHQNAPHLASKRTPFCSKQPRNRCKWRPFQIKIHFLAFTCYPFLHQNKPSRESIICGKVGNWWTKRALIMLNFMLKTGQKKRFHHIHAHGQRHREHTRLQLPAQAIAGHSTRKRKPD